MSLTDMASNESWNTMEVFPIDVVCDYDNDRSSVLLGQILGLASYFMAKSRLFNSNDTRR